MAAAERRGRWSGREWTTLDRGARTPTPYVAKQYTLPRSNRSKTTIDLLRRVLDPPVLGASADLVHGVEAREDKFHARCANRRIARGVHLKCLVPCRRHALHPLRIM